jgi:transposase
LLIADSQAVKNAFSAWSESKGFCFYKSTNGIKRHLVVDVLGYPVFTECTKASLSDNQGLIDMLIGNKEYFVNRPMSLPKLVLLVDSGYHVDFLNESLKEHPEILEKVAFQNAPKMSKEMKKEKGLKGFVPIAKRWIIERSNSWVEKCKSLVKNFERNLENSNFKLQLCFIRLMLIHIARGFANSSFFSHHLKHGFA